MSPTERFAKNVKRARASLHRTEIGLLERGERLPRIDSAAKLAGALGVPVAELLVGIEWTPVEMRFGGFVGSEP